MSTNNGSKLYTGNFILGPSSEAIAVPDRSSGIVLNAYSASSIHHAHL
jgi:hypothetical protein